MSTVAPLNIISCYNRQSGRGRGAHQKPFSSKCVRSYPIHRGDRNRHRPNRSAQDRFTRFQRLQETLDIQVKSGTGEGSRQAVKRGTPREPYEKHNSVAADKVPETTFVRPSVRVFLVEVTSEYGVGAGGNPGAECPQAMIADEF